jgi:hypothetical protein
VAASLSSAPLLPVAHEKAYDARHNRVRGQNPSNGHMPMMDRNSDQVAQMIQKWMADKGLMK